MHKQKMVKLYFSTRNVYIWAKILQYIVVALLLFMFIHNVFSKVHPRCHNIASGIKSGCNSWKTDKHAADCSKAVCWGCKVIYMRCINCSYDNMAKDIRLLDKKAFFVYTGKISYKLELLKAISPYIVNHAENPPAFLAYILGDLRSAVVSPLSCCRVLPITIIY